MNIILIHITIIIITGLLVTSSASAKESSPLIEEVLVTATKRTTNVQDTAGSISALGAETIKFREINDFYDMRSMVPNMTFTEFGGAPLISIRGIGQGVETGVGDPAIASHIDGVYLPRPGQVSAGNIDMERIEVLRGPQGTLYGRNATGGVLNFVQAKPEDNYDGGTEISHARFGRNKLKLWQNIPVTDQLSIRVAANYDEYEGENRNIELDEIVGSFEQSSARFALRYDVTDNVNIDLSIFRQEYNAVGPASNLLLPPSDLLGIPVAESDYTLEPRYQRSDFTPFTEKGTDGAIVSMNWTVNDINIKSITGYLDHYHHSAVDTDATARYMLKSMRDEESKALSQELNISGTNLHSKLSWLFGLYWFEDKGYISIPASANLGLLGAIQPAILDNLGLGGLSDVGVVAELEQHYDEENRAYAAFADATYSLTNYLRLNLGIRSGREVRSIKQTYNAYGVTPIGNISVAGLLVSDPCSAESYEIRARSTDPKVSLELDLSEDTMMYAQYQTAFKSGGFNISACNDQYDPEIIDAYEVGFKSSWLNNRLSFNISAFHYVYDGFQVFQVDGIQSTIRNAASLTSMGVDLESAFHLNERLSFDFNGGLLDATYDEFYDKDGFNNTALIIMPSNAPEEDLSGNSHVRSPKNSYTLGVNWQKNINSFGFDKMRVRLESYYTDEFYFRQFNNEHEKQKSYRLYNAFISLWALDSRLQIKFFGKNLTNEEYLTVNFPITPTKTYLVNYGESRSYGISLRYEW